MSNSHNLGHHEIKPENAVDTEALEDEMAHYKDIIKEVVKENARLSETMVKENSKLIHELVIDFNLRLSKKDEEIARLNKLLVDQTIMIGRLESNAQTVRPYNPPYPQARTQAGNNGQMPQVALNVMPSNSNTRHGHFEHPQDHRNY